MLVDRVWYEVRGDVAGGAINLRVARVSDEKWARFLATIFADSGEFDYGTVAVYAVTIQEERVPL